MGINTAIRTVEEFLNQAKGALGTRSNEDAGKPSAEGRKQADHEPSSLLDAGGAATYLNLSVSWVYKAAERGELPCLRIGTALRFDPEALRSWVRSRSTSPTRRRSV